MIMVSERVCASRCAKKSLGHGSKKRCSMISLLQVFVAGAHAQAPSLWKHFCKNTGHTLQRTENQPDQKERGWISRETRTIQPMLFNATTAAGMAVTHANIRAGSPKTTPRAERATAKRAAIPFLRRQPPSTVRTSAHLTTRNRPVQHRSPLTITLPPGTESNRRLLFIKTNPLWSGYATIACYGIEEFAFISISPRRRPFSARRAFLFCLRPDRLFAGTSKRTVSGTRLRHRGAF